MKDAVKLGLFAAVAVIVARFFYWLVTATLTLIGTILALALCYGLLKVLDKWELIFG